MVDHHHNNPPLADQLELAYAVTQLAEDHAALAREAEALTTLSAAMTTVNSVEDNARASAFVIELRNMATRIDTAHDDIKAPVLQAGRNVDLFFFGLNNSDTKRPGPVTREKQRLEREIRDHGFRVAAEQRRLAEEAAAAEREKAQLAEIAAQKAEEENRTQVADVLMDSAIKTEAIADRLDERASGPVQDLARVRSAVATSGVRAVPGFEITDREELRKSLGVLGNSFTADAVMAAIRKFRSDGEAYGKWQFKENDQDKPKRYVVARPELPGVEFFIEYAGSVRA